MNREPRTCVAATLGQTCNEPPTMLEPAPLCDEHKVQVALRVSQDVLSSVLAEVRGHMTGQSQVIPAAEEHLISSAQSVGFPEETRHGSVVYFLANGGRVKIGFTKRLVSRLSALSLRDDAVLLLLQGGGSLERSLHLRFGAYRIGDSEWFELAPEIIRFIANKGPKLGKTRPTSRNKRPGRSRTSARQHRRTEAELVVQAIAVNRAYLEEHGRPIPAEKLARALTIGKPAALELVKQVRGGHIDIAK